MALYIRELQRSGDIYKGEYTGWYDEGQEEYVPENTARENDFKSAINRKPLVKRTEPCYFFRLGKYQERLREKVKELLEEIEAVNEAENEEYGDNDLEEMGGGGEIDAEKLEKKIAELNQRLKEQPENKKLAKAVKVMEKDYLPRQKRYEEQERKLSGRRSYSKTDEDATFFRMKEDRGAEKPLPKPAYNVQTGTRRTVCGWVQPASESWRHGLPDPASGRAQGKLEQHCQAQA